MNFSPYRKETEMDTKATYGDLTVGDRLYTENGGYRGTVVKIVRKRQTGRLEIHTDRGLIGRGGRPLINKFQYRPDAPLHGTAYWVA